MGCHTWFLKKDNIKLEEAKQKAWEYFIKHKDKYNPIDFDFEKRNFHELSIWREYYGYACDKICYVEDAVFVSSDELPHDLFRTTESCSYTHENLRSLDSTLAFIKKHNISIEGKKLERLIKFWKNNPDGLIKFG